MISFTIGIKTPNPLNGSQGFSRGAAMAAAQRRNKQRSAAALLTLGYRHRWTHVPSVCTLTRLSSGTLDDDGLRAALKSVRDGICDALRINDGPKSPMRWEYTQEKCKRGVHAVRIEIVEQRFEPKPKRKQNVNSA